MWQRRTLLKCHFKANTVNHIWSFHQLTEGKRQQVNLYHRHHCYLLSSSYSCWNVRWKLSDHQSVSSWQNAATVCHLSSHICVYVYRLVTRQELANHRDSNCLITRLAVSAIICMVLCTIIVTKYKVRELTNDITYCWIKTSPKSKFFLIFIMLLLILCHIYNVRM